MAKICTYLQIKCRSVPAMQSPVQSVVKNIIYNNVILALARYISNWTSIMLKTNNSDHKIRYKVDKDNDMISPGWKKCVQMVDTTCWKLFSFCFSVRSFDVIYDHILLYVLQTSKAPSKMDSQPGNCRGPFYFYSGAYFA